MRGMCMSRGAGIASAVGRVLGDEVERTRTDTGDASPDTGDDEQDEHSMCPYDVLIVS